MTYNKEEVEKNIKICWICRRTEEESLSDFKKLILEYDGKVGNEPIISSEIKDNIKNVDIIAYPEKTDWESDILMRFGAFNKETGDNVEIKSNHNIFTLIHICPVCDAILTDIWQSAQDNAIETMREEYHRKIMKAACILMEDDCEEESFKQDKKEELIGTTNTTNSNSAGTC